MNERKYIFALMIHKTNKSSKAMTHPGVDTTRWLIRKLFYKVLLNPTKSDSG